MEKYQRKIFQLNYSERVLTTDQVCVSLQVCLCGVCLQQVRWFHFKVRSHCELHDQQVTRRLKGTRGREAVNC